MKKSHIVLSAIILASIVFVGFKSTTQEKGTQFTNSTITIAEPLNIKDTGYILTIQSGATKQIKFSMSELSSIGSEANKEMNKLGINGFRLSTSVQNVVERIDSNHKSASYIETTHTFIKEEN